LEQRSERLVVSRLETSFGSHPPYYFMPGLLKMGLSDIVRDVDLAHTVGYYFFGTVFAHFTGRLHGVPHVTTPVYTLNPSTWQRRTFDAAMGRRIVRQAAHVIPQSAHEVQLMRSNRFELRTSTIVPFGVDSGCFEQDHDVNDLRARYGIGRDEAVLLFVGKVMSPKGAFHALDAVARLRREGRKLRLIMIGEVHDRELQSFRDRIRDLGLETAVVLPGAITDRLEIARHYQLSDAVLFPSQYEQFGIVAVEAAASGRPLVGTPVGIMQTLVPQNQFGLLHAFDDIDSFTRNVAEVLDSPRYRDNAAKHRREILERYDWRSISAQTESIYDEARARP
jgi:glycosyltransferase involved in cell wall biosynthesis